VKVPEKETRMQEQYMFLPLARVQELFLSVPEQAQGSEMIQKREKK
jgi:hypothetical protein